MNTDYEHTIFTSPIKNEKCFLVRRSIFIIKIEISVKVRLIFKEWNNYHQIIKYVLYPEIRSLHSHTLHKTFIFLSERYSIVRAKN